MRVLTASLICLSFLHAKPQQRMPAPPPPLTRSTLFDSGLQTGIHVWGDVSYLYWWTKNASLPVAIATSGSSSDAAPAALGQPGTEILFGDQSIHNGAQSGFRISLRSWLAQNNNYAVETSGFYLPEKTTTLFSDESSTILGVPFINVAPFPLPAGHGGWSSAGPGDTAILLGNESLDYTGSITAKSSTQLWGVEFNGLFHFLSRPTFRLSAIGGISYTDLAESLNLNYSSIRSPENIFLTTVIEDHFRMHNEIYTGQLGLRGEWSKGWLFASFIAKLGLGAAVQNAHINGSFTDPIPNLYFSYGSGNSGGVFTQLTNSGKHSKVHFEAVPSATLRFGLNCLKNLRIFFGYDIIFLNSVLRPAEQIDNTINETGAGSSAGNAPVLSGQPYPKTLMHTTTYWAQGINAGIEARF